jgi:hypothetical protein
VFRYLTARSKHLEPFAETMLCNAYWKLPTTTHPGQDGQNGLDPGLNIQDWILKRRGGAATWYV